MIKGLQAERPAFLGDLLDAMTARGKALIGWRSTGEPLQAPELARLGELLLSRRGEASGVAIAKSLVAAYANATKADRLTFLMLLAEKFGPDEAAVEAAVAARQAGTAGALEALHSASEPRRQELFRRINLAPGGTRALVAMREDLLDTLPKAPALRAVDADFAHLFGSWFNRGFLTLRQIDWNTPASILEKIIRYEAVHQIRNWDDLRNRLQPTDRRCYAFFHPQLADEPLIFVEVALTAEMPAAIAPLLELERQPIAAAQASTAVFYSISNTQRGLAGVSFGNFLIKQVVELLSVELPAVRNFVTLSPVPGFAAWLKAQGEAEPLQALLDAPDWPEDPVASAEVSSRLLPFAAKYFLEARGKGGRPVDAVARFHLGNGARLERVNPLGDLSVNGLRQSHGLMVNYLYALGEIESNHEAFVETGAIAASDALRGILPNRTRKTS